MPLTGYLTMTRRARKVTVNIPNNVPNIVANNMIVILYLHTL